MDLNRHLTNCPRCKQSVNGHTLIHAAQDDIAVFGLVADVVKTILHLRVNKVRDFRYNHLKDPHKCPVCGQNIEDDWTSGVTNFFKNL
jgi:endogenous inhibitor of DNA gyrase (YacG/DUF329 family)